MSSIPEHDAATGTRNRNRGPSGWAWQAALAWNAAGRTAVQIPLPDVAGANTSQEDTS